MRLTVTDRISYNIGTSRIITDEGFLRVPGHVSRTGILTYLARELNLDGDPNRLVNVYRPAEEVFSPDSLASFTGADVTIEHPKNGVTSDNYTQTSAGVVVGAGVQDGECVRCDLLIKAKDAVQAVQSGKCELSCGYTALYDAIPGVTEDGTPYEFIQRDIKINHVAIVSRGRSGSNVRIFDNKPEKPAMKIVALTNDRSIEVADDATALLISDTIAALTKRAEDAEAKADAAEAEKEDMKEKMEEMDKKSCDSAISERIKLIASTTADARKVAGDNFTSDSLDIVQIMRDALTVKRPTVAWADKSPAYVQAAWDLALTDDAATQTDQYKQLAQDGATVTADAKPSAYDSLKAGIANAWKGK